MIYSWKTHQ
jgi:long-chain acyl-CoA synthetase